MHILKLFLAVISGTTIQFSVNGIVSPQQILQKDTQTLVFVDDGKIYELNLLSQELIFENEIQPNVFVGINEEGDLQYCEIAHFIIHSKEEFSTMFKVNGEQFSFFETIRPISWEGDRMIAVTALDFLEQHYYEIDTNTGEYHEVPHPPFELHDSDLVVKEDVFGNMSVSYSPTRILVHLLGSTLQLALQDIYRKLSL